MRLGILTSHPIQYQAPWFRALAGEVELEVFFAHRPDSTQQGEGFGKGFSWDVDLLSGYKHHFLKNVSPQPSPSHFFGCDTPEIVKIIEGLQDDGPRTTGQQVNGRSSVVSGQRPRRFDAFIVCGWHLKTYWQAIRACRRAGIPVLVRGDSQLMTPRSRLKTWAKEIGYRLMLQQFDGFLVVGQRNREYLAHYGVSAEKMFFAPHFVDNDFFRQIAETLKSQKTEIRKRWGVPVDAFCVLFCGKFIAKKRPLDLVEAARILTAENAKNAKEGGKPSVHLLFVGSGELGELLRARCDVVFDAENSAEKQKPETETLKVESRGRRAEGRNLPDSVSARPRATFAGFLNQSELPAAYVAADVMVLPSESETWGLAVNEAMACGLPAIVADAVGCAPDLIEEGKTGFTFSVGDSADLAERLERLTRRQDGCFDFSSALHQKLTNYSVRAAVAGTLQAAKSLAAK
jgi:glycosyltransferase involved in cell wall biosynthesis